MTLIKPHEVTVKGQDGTEKKFLVSKIPAMDAREIFTQYPLSAMPKVGDYKVNEQIALKMLSYVAVPMESTNPLKLTSRELINNHCPDWEMVLRLEAAMIEYNCSFFQNGKAMNFFADLVRNFQQLIGKTLTDSLAQSLRKDAPRSTN